MKITLIFRHPGEYSIEHVFNILSKEFEKRRLDIENIFLPCRRIFPISLLRNLLFLIRKKGDINHVTGDVHYSILALPKNSILTVHDLRINSVRNYFKRITLNLLFNYFPFKRAKYITTISTFTKNEIIEKYPWAENKVRVIYNPVDPRFSRFDKEFDELKPVILHIGTASNKNLFRVCCALNGIACKLRIIGKLSEEQISCLIDNNIDYSNDHNLSDEDILREYRSCDIVSFLSLYEGFGMPIIEGQSVGRIVVTSDIEPLVEVAGGASILVDPLSIQSIKAGFISAIYNKELRESLIMQGFVNVQRFEISNIADQYIQLYKEISPAK